MNVLKLTDIVCCSTGVTRLHAHQTCKIGGTAHIAYWLSVPALVLEAREDEDEAIASLLHDANVFIAKETSRI